MAITNLDIHHRAPYADGHEFGAAGAYERIDATAHYAVDPDLPANAGITDLARAPRDAGQVRFQGDVTLLVPLGTGNGALLVEFPNRGNRLLTSLFNQAPFDLMPSEHIEPGDGFLMRHGWTLAWCGWQWDVPKPGPRIGLDAPMLDAAARSPDGAMQLRIQPDRAVAHFALTDHHVGSIGSHRPIAAREPHDAEALLMVRDARHGEALLIPRERWRFARDENGTPVTDVTHVWLEGGFEPGRIYDLVYTPAECPVVGAGLLAMRDLASWLRRDAASPLAGRVEHVVGEGISQCGRLMRTFLGLGLNADGSGQPAYDGLLVHVAGGRRGEFNQRYGQPSVQPTPNLGHRFPFADAPQIDAVSGTEAGLLDRQRQTGCMPRIMYTDTSAEYWRGDASLAHTSAADGGDVPLPAEVRRYLFASTQHGPGAPPLTDESPFGTHGSNWFNIVDYRPLYRAALTNLLAWVRDEAEPPPSVYPRASDGTGVTRATVLDMLEDIPGITCPDRDALPAVAPLAFGARESQGIPVLPAPLAGPAYPCRVSAVDGNGNETGGVRMPDVEVPLATHTGFNVRHADSGGAGQLLEYLGATLPFAPHAQAREASGDPRPSLAERYAGREDYLDQVRDAARRLAARRLLLDEDVDTCVALAGARFDAIAEAHARERGRGR